MKLKKNNNWKNKGQIWYKNQIKLNFKGWNLKEKLTQKNELKQSKIN
jgi:hypothetical protein